MEESEKGESVAATTRQRILVAALAAFAEDGFDVGLRAIATRAGVTAGLITHYYGSKARLRQECDAYVLELVEQDLPQAFDARALQQRLIDDPAMLVRCVHYCMRAFAEGSQMCQQLLTISVDHTRRMIASGLAADLLKPSADEEVRALVVVRVTVGVAMLDFAIDAPSDAQAVGDFLRQIWRHVLLPMARSTNGAHFDTDPDRGGLLQRASLRVSA
ncbi:TetR/AcrR family transcriptional regulator [Ruania halotolerans]|uniref:TetR/AcrR family transcriptional regulator n=1 Tax=Ruania halotolerans TaxID=2897773 RepID=UPI001E299B9A|nr:TetR family transcriptional regulator [Ruania halotolerans]UFU07093.1 TetR/AcrR family transcriptional regulator [Ruania halotolerans]